MELSLLLLLLLNAAVASEVRTFKWKVEYINWSPDCVERTIIGINGQYPGPTIRATAGDTIVVELENGLETEGLVIHWHGILQRGTPFYDGAAYVSQCPINPVETFEYRFVVDEPGTYFYHGHFGMQRSAGLYGSLIVDAAPGQAVPFSYDGELSILINDWWHRSIYSLQAGLNSDPFRFVGEPQSLLIEGRGRYNCSLIPQSLTSPLAGDVASCNATSPQCTPHVLTVEPGKRYRLRVSSVASLSSLNLVLEGHNMTLVEADGNYVQPQTVSNLDVYAGQSYSVLFTASADPGRNYWVSINIRGRRPTTPPGLAVLRYAGNPELQLPPTPAPTNATAPVAWDDLAYSVAQQRLIKGLPGLVEPPAKPQRRHARRLELLNTQNRVDGKLRWAINNVTYMPRPTPLLAALRYNLTAAAGYNVQPPARFQSGYAIHRPPPHPVATSGSGVYVFEGGEVVDIVVQNANTLTPNSSEVHPWHLHGHEFWVLGYGWGVYRDRNAKELNLKDPPLRNTVALFPLGWTYIRFRADNPGAWPFHCHIESHFHMGMGVMFAVDVPRIPTPPPHTLGCGFTRLPLPRH